MTVFDKLAIIDRAVITGLTPAMPKERFRIERVLVERGRTEATVSSSGITEVERPPSSDGGRMRVRGTVGRF